MDKEVQRIIVPSVGPNPQMKVFLASLAQLCAIRDLIINFDIPTTEMPKNHIVSSSFHDYIGGSISSPSIYHHAIHVAGPIYKGTIRYYQIQPIMQATDSPVWATRRRV